MSASKWIGEPRVVRRLDAYDMPVITVMLGRQHASGRVETRCWRVAWNGWARDLHLSGPVSRPASVAKLVAEAVEDVRAAAALR